MASNVDGNGRELPDGWAWTSLDAVRVDKSRSITPKKMPEDYFELYSVPSFDEAKPQIVTGREIGSSKRTVSEQTVILCKINPRINRIWVVGNHSPWQKIASTEWIPFSPVTGIVPDYLCYFMQQNSFRDYLALHASGVGGSLMRVKPATFEGYAFPLAPVNEQRRIVAEIETQFSRLDKVVAALERLQANLKRYRASVLKAACEGRLVPTEMELHRRGEVTSPTAPPETADVLLERILAERRARWEAEQWEKEIERAKKKAAQAKRKAAGLPHYIRDLEDVDWIDVLEEDYGGYLPKENRWKEKYKEPEGPEVESLPELPEGWCWVRAEQISEFITKGTTPKANKLFGPGDDRARIPFIKVYNLRFDGTLDFSINPTFVSEKTHLEDLRRSIVMPNDVLMNIVGPPLGKVSIVPDLYSEWNINQAMARYRPFAGYDVRFLCYALRAEHIQNWAVTRAKATAGQFNLTLEICRDLPLPLAPMGEQTRIVDEVERRLSVVGALEKLVEENLRRAERLRQAILKRAFEGRLVAQDPQDEPAELLLERIRAQREGWPVRRKRTLETEKTGEKKRARQLKLFQSDSD
jgi:type I restriction enzyme S subunit